MIFEQRNVARQFDNSIGDYCNAEDSEAAALQIMRPYESISLSKYGCRLSIATVSAVSCISSQEIQAVTRSTADIAIARQTAMYLAHTKFGITFTEIGIQFNRDRSTVAHGCRLIEDKRDSILFDQQVSRMENLVDVAMCGSMSVFEFLSSRRSREYGI